MNCLRYFILSGLLLPITTFLFCQSNDSDKFIITAGRYFVTEVEADSLGKAIGEIEFYGIYKDGNTVTIRPTGELKLRTMDMKRQVDIHLPKYITVKKKFIRNKKTGVKMSYVRLYGGGFPLVYLSLPAYTAEPHIPAVAKREALPVNGDLGFSFAGNDYLLEHSATLHQNDYPSDIRINLRNLTTGVEQLLSVRDSMRSTRTYIVFAGDIDGDGRLDLILDESPAAHHGHLKLYLSSLAADGELVGLAASEHNSEDPPYEYFR